MGKRSHRRPVRHEENNVGCVWGLIRMLYFRRDPKFLLDRNQVSRRHTVREITGRGHSKKSMDFGEIDEDDDNIEECTAEKPTVKKLMEDELKKFKLLKKIPNDEVQRILANLEDDVCLDESSKQTSKPRETSNHHTDIFVASRSGLVDPDGSKSLNQAEENDLEFVLADFLGEIYRCHNECPHGDCKNRSDLCPSLKSLIHKKLIDLNNPPCNYGYEQSRESEGKKLIDEKKFYSSRAAQSKEFKDALEILCSNKELFLKLLQKPNSHILENIQKHQNRKTETTLEPRKMLGTTSFVEETKSSNQHELSIKTQVKESKHMFFWKKDKSNSRQVSEGTNSAQPVSKIVILKPSRGRGIDPAASTSTRSLHQQPCTLQAPECSGRENSKFSIKEVRRRFRIVTGESRRERNSVPADDLQRDPRWLKDSVVAIKKDSRHLPERNLADKSSSAAKNDNRPSISSKQKQGNLSQNDISSHMIPSKDASVFYEEAKKHLTEMLNEKNQGTNYPTIQVSKSLGGMLCLPQCSVSTPRSDLREEDCLVLSPEEANVSPIHEVEREEESAKERSQLEGDSKSAASGTSTAVDEHVTIQVGHCTKEETTQEGARAVIDDVGIICIEGIDKLDFSEKICNEQCPTVEQCRDDQLLEMIQETEPEKQLVQMFPSSPESIVEKPEQQDPETPKPSASTRLISPGSPERIHEKQEQPSPVSVLDLFYEDAASPDCKNMTECESHEDFLGTQHFPDTESDLMKIWEDKNVRLDYIKLVLELSELCAEQNLEVWYLEDELISPCLFDELQNQGDQIEDLKLLFDCICGALTVIQERYFRLSPRLSFLRHEIQTPPMGENLALEVSKYVDGCLLYSYPSTLDQIVRTDLEDQAWMDLRSKTEGIIMEIWEFVLDDLIDEAVFDLWI